MTANNTEDGQHSKCPPHLTLILAAELSAGNLRYMLSMYWQGRADKISMTLRPMLDWLTKNGLPADVASTWSQFEPGQIAFKDQDHQKLLEVAMVFAASSVEL